jgi:hypothetical protein
MENLISSSYRNFLLGLIFLLKTEMKEFSTKMKKLKKCHENFIDHAIIKNTYGKKNIFTTKHNDYPNEGITCFLLYLLL